jgi:methyl-accepting chemotaxis protein
MWRSLGKVSTRLLVLALLPLCVLTWVGWLVVHQGRANLYTQRMTEIRHIVEAAVSIVADFEKRALAGEMTRDEAQTQAKGVLNALRYAGNEYVFVLDFDHRMVVHPIKPDQVGRERTFDKDTQGRFFVQEFITVGKKGDGFVTYGFQKPQSAEFEEKVSYVTGYAPWRWVLGSGVLVDDIEAMHSAIVRKFLVGIAAATLLIACCGFVVAYSLTKPLKRLTGSLGRLASGDVEAIVEGAERWDELGTIARGVVAVRDAIKRQMDEHMARETEFQIASSEERRRMISSVTRSLDDRVKAIANSIERAANDLVASAATTETESERARDDAASAAVASRDTVEQIIRIRQATVELDKAIAHISGRAAESSDVARHAVVQIRDATTLIKQLSEASSNIAKVVSMIHAIAGQTNLLALNATIEAARAGQAGKGFAVVASEVKQLAAQTTKATEEIASRIDAVLEATQGAVDAIQKVDHTIQHIEQIAGVIAGTVEQQAGATTQIADVVGHTMTQANTLAQSVTNLARAVSSTNS